MNEERSFANVTRENQERIKMRRPNCLVFKHKNIKKRSFSTIIKLYFVSFVQFSCVCLDVKAIIFMKYLNYPISKLIRVAEMKSNSIDVQ